MCINLLEYQKLHSVALIRITCHHRERQSGLLPLCRPRMLHGAGPTHGAESPGWGDAAPGPADGAPCPARTKDSQPGPESSLSGPQRSWSAQKESRPVSPSSRSSDPAAASGAGWPRAGPRPLGAECILQAPEQTHTGEQISLESFQKKIIISSQGQQTLEVYSNRFWC